MTDTATTTTAKKGAIHLSTADFESTVKSSAVPVLVDFYAEWCGPCKLAAPIIDKLAGEYEGKVLITKIDTDENIDLARQFGVMSIPTVMIFQKDGEEIKVIDKKVGFPGEAGYRQMLEKVAPQDAAKAA